MKPKVFNYKLKWKDFKVRKSGIGTRVARIEGRIGRIGQPVIKQDMQTKKWSCVKFESTVILKKSKMWVKKGAETNDLLAHEQGHYDILTIYAKGWEDDNLNIIDRNSRGIVKREINSNYLRNLREGRRTDRNYERETANGTNARAQKKWLQKIHKLKYPPSQSESALGVSF